MKNNLMLVVVFLLLSACGTQTTKTTDDSLSTQEVVVPEETTSVLVEPPVADESEPSLQLAPTAGKVYYFEYDRAILSRQSQIDIAEHADFIKNNRITVVRIEGHTDERGSREYNIALGEQRAIAVKNFLISRGLAESSIQTVSYGEEKPVVVGNSESEWSQNRRAILSY